MEIFLNEELVTGNVYAPKEEDKKKWEERKLDLEEEKIQQKF